MDLSKILAISGRPGLYKVISQAKQAVIVESLLDHKRFPAFGHEKITALEEISIYTTGEERPLKEVLKTIYEKLNGKASVDPRSDNQALIDSFRELIPDYNPEKVYVSDIKKIFSWYNILLQHNLLDFGEPEEKEEKKREENPDQNQKVPEKDNERKE